MEAMRREMAKMAEADDRIEEALRDPEVGKNMEAMRREMAKMAEADDRIEEALRDPDEDRDTAFEVQKFLEEMALDAMGPLAKTTVASPPVATPVVPDPVPVAPTRQLVSEAVGVSAPPRESPPRPAPYPPPPAQVEALQPTGGVADGLASAQYDQPTIQQVSDRQEPVSSQPLLPPLVAPQTASSAPAPPAQEPVKPAVSSVDTDDLMARLAALKK